GWLMWFTRAASWASVINVLAASLGFYWPSVTAGTPRMLVMTEIIATLAAMNIRGIRQSSVVLNALTIGKIAPLLVFIGAGLFFIDPSALVPGPLPTMASLSASALLLIFAFGGYE